MLPAQSFGALSPTLRAHPEPTPKWRRRVGRPNEPGQNEPGQNEPGQNEPGRNEPTSGRRRSSRPPRLLAI
jgi:hypothetical protein